MVTGGIGALLILLALGSSSCSAAVIRTAPTDADVASPLTGDSGIMPPAYHLEKLAWPKFDAVAGTGLRPDRVGGAWGCAACGRHEVISPHRGRSGARRRTPGAHRLRAAECAADDPQRGSDQLRPHDPRSAFRQPLAYAALAGAVRRCWFPAATPGVKDFPAGKRAGAGCRGRRVQGAQAGCRRMPRRIVAGAQHRSGNRQIGVVRSQDHPR